MAVEERQHRLLEAIATLEGEIGADTINSSQIAETLKMSIEDVQEVLSELADEGYVEVESTDSEYAVRLTQQGRDVLTQ